MNNEHIILVKIIILYNLIRLYISKIILYIFLFVNKTLIFFINIFDSYQCYLLKLMLTYEL